MAPTCQKAQQSRRIDLLPWAPWRAQATALHLLLLCSLEGCASLCAGESSPAQHCPSSPARARGWVNLRVPLGGKSLKARTPALCAGFCLLADTGFQLLSPSAPLQKYQCSLIMGLNAVAADKGDKITHAHCHGNLWLFSLDVCLLFGVSTDVWVCLRLSLGIT